MCWILFELLLLMVCDGLLGLNFLCVFVDAACFLTCLAEETSAHWHFYPLIKYGGSRRDPGPIP